MIYLTEQINFSHTHESCLSFWFFCHLRLRTLKTYFASMIYQLHF